MLTAIRIENFRGFRHLDFSPFRQFNIVVGENASGKTALLEAIFLASANSPEASLRLRAWRGLGVGAEVSTERTSYEALWRDLFFEDSRELLVEVDDATRGTRSCRIRYHSDESLTVPLDTASYGATAFVPVQFEWEANGARWQSRIEISPSGLKLQNVPESKFPSVFLPSGFKGGTAETARRYSALSKENQESQIGASLTKLYPFVRSLSLEVDSSGPMLYATVSGLQKKLPLPTTSEGINKALSMILALHAVKDGVLLVDEVENGFYRGRFAPLMSLLVSDAQALRVQMFLTTHSMEFLQSLLPLIKERSESFSLIRARRDRATGECSIEAFGGQKMAAAIEEGFEIR